MLKSEANLPKAQLTGLIIAFSKSDLLLYQFENCKFLMSFLASFYHIISRYRLLTAAWHCARCQGRKYLWLGLMKSLECILLKGDVRATSKQLNVTRKYIRECIEHYKQNTQGDTTEEICRCYFCGVQGGLLLLGEMWSGTWPGRKLHDRNSRPRANAKALR